jgi:hypothetical protein
LVVAGGGWIRIGMFAHAAQAHRHNAEMITARFMVVCSFGFFFRLGVP